jgi:hypothetical protein
MVDIIIDTKGRLGKSTTAQLCKYYNKKRTCLIMPAVNDAKQLIETACNMCTAKNLRNVGFFIDMPRAMSKDRLYGLYAGIEGLKTGELCDLRNKYKEWVINKPKIWVFTNQMPDIHLLSQDRWRFWKINEKKELVKMTDEDIYELTCDEVVVTSDGLEPTKPMKKKKESKQIESDADDTNNSDSEDLDAMFTLLLNKIKKRDKKKKHKEDNDNESVETKPRKKLF